MKIYAYAHPTWCLSLVSNLRKCGLKWTDSFVYAMSFAFNTAHLPSADCNQSNQSNVYSARLFVELDHVCVCGRRYCLFSTKLCNCVHLSTNHMVMSVPASQQFEEIHWLGDKVFSAQIFFLKPIRARRNPIFTTATDGFAATWGYLVQGLRPMAEW